jgi:hypothetical protein
VQQRKERENEEEEAYQHLSDAYNDFLKVVLANADLQLRSSPALPEPTPEQHERMLIVFDMLVSLFERAYLVAYKDEMSATERRRWNLGRLHARLVSPRRFLQRLARAVARRGPGVPALAQVARDERGAQVAHTLITC